MPSNSDRPFGHETLKLRAAFVPEGMQNQPSGADIQREVGYGAAKVPAAFVPEGATPPGHPFVKIAQAEFRPDMDGGQSSAATRSFSSSQSSRPDQPDGDDTEPPVELPRTRYRFGSALGGGQASPPPNPTLGDTQAGAAQAAIRVWRSISKAGRLKPAPTAQSASGQDAASTAPGNGDDLPQSAP